jgi:hypothetical protein
MSRRSPADIRFEVLDCKTIPKGMDEYGELASGTLHLLGSCLPVTWKSTTDKTFGFSSPTF